MGSRLRSVKTFCNCCSDGKLEGTTGELSGHASRRRSRFPRDRCCSPKPQPLNACAQDFWVSVAWTASQMISHICRVLTAPIADVNWRCSNWCRTACFKAAKQYASRGCSHGVSPAGTKCRNTPAVAAARTTRSVRCEGFASMLNKICRVGNIPSSALPNNLNTLQNKSVPAQADFFRRTKIVVSRRAALRCCWSRTDSTCVFPTKICGKTACASMSSDTKASRDMVDFLRLRSAFASPSRKCCFR